MGKRISKSQADYEAYCARSAELECRIAAGESITDIMRADQLERGIRRIAEIMAQDASDREGE